MDQYYFLCTFEGCDWRIRAKIFVNEQVYLYEVTPEDNGLFSRFGVKFVTQPKWAFWGARCTNSTDGHVLYENAVLAALKDFLLMKRILSV